MTIKRFLTQEFGMGGVQNYTQEQAVAVMKLIKLFYSDNFANAERDTIADFLKKNERNDNSFADRIEKLQDESEDLGVEI